MNIIGAIHGTFNMPSDVHEIRRLVEGIGCDVNLVYPIEAHIDDTPRLADAVVNVCLYREFGRKLCEELGKPYLQAPIGVFATTAFLRQLGELAGVDPEPFIEREKRTTIKAIWDLWRSVTQDFFATGSFAIVATETYERGVRHFLEEELGIPCSFSVARRPGTKPDNQAVRASLKTTPPLVLFGSSNERIYAVEQKARCIFVPSLVPRRDHQAQHRHAVHGLRGRHLPGAGILQRAVRRPVRHAAARHGELDRDRGDTFAPHRGDTGPSRSNLVRWESDATAELARHLEREPFLVRISAAKKLRERIEHDAREAQETRVTLERAQRTLGVAETLARRAERTVAVS